MKAIVSHDIDHLKASEHLFHDLILPKHLLRNHIELGLRKITTAEYLERWKDLFRNKWENLEALIEFNNSSGVPSQFFIAVQRGLGLNYSIDAAKQCIELLKSRQCRIGCHGIAYDKESDMKKEHDLFQKLSGLSDFGIRMHYVRQNHETIPNMEKCGYAFDSTEFSFKNPYRIGRMWEFPIQIMDGWIIENKKGWQARNLNEAKECTMSLVQKARENKLGYLNIVFHDRYFSESFKTWMNWYCWLIEYLKKENIQVISFSDAMLELENGRMAASYAENISIQKPG